MDPTKKDEDNHDGCVENLKRFKVVQNEVLQNRFLKTQHND